MPNAEKKSMSPGIFLLHSSTPTLDSRMLLQPLAQGLDAAGWIVREASRQPGDDAGTALAEYESFASGSGVDPGKIVLIGFDGSADWIAREYYSLYSRNPPLAAVLLSAPAQPLYWNQLTIPFLAVYGHRDPRFGEDPDFVKRLREGIHHHQARYGDSTRAIEFAHYGIDLANAGELGNDVVESVTHWLQRTLMSPSRPQEDLDSGRLRRTG